MPWYEPFAGVSCKDYHKQYCRSAEQVVISICQCRKPAFEDKGSPESKRISNAFDIEKDDCLISVQDVPKPRVYRVAILNLGGRIVQLVGRHPVGGMIQHQSEADSFIYAYS